MKSFNNDFRSRKWSAIHFIQIVSVLAIFFGARAEEIFYPVCDMSAHNDVPEVWYEIDEGCFTKCVSPYDSSPCGTQTCCGPGGGPAYGGGPGGGPAGGPGPGGAPGFRGRGVQGAAEGNSGCGSCPGMPTWFVTEPNLNLFLEDTPFRYRPSRGLDIEFQLYFKNTLGANGIVDASQYLIFGVGTNWNTPWRSYLMKRLTDPGPGGEYFLFNGNGRIVHLARGYVDYETTAKFDPGDRSDTFYLTFPNGIRHIFGPKVMLAGTELWFLTSIEDPSTNAITFEYATSGNTIRLSKIVDVDHRETTFLYTNTTYYSNLISQVSGPSGETVQLKYDGQGRLTNIVDVVQLSSSIQYDSSNRLSKLVTPYGTNSYQYYAGTGWNGFRVTEQDVRVHFFLEGDGPATLFPTASGDIADLSYYLTQAGITGTTFDTDNLNERNTYYWGPRQYANLSSGVRTNLDNATFTMTNVSSSDYLKGHTRHWLAVADGPHDGPFQLLFAGNTLALEREPSPDPAGNTEGIITWYDHEGKGTVDREGFQKQPRIVGRRVSEFEWQIDAFTRHWNGTPLLHFSNYGLEGSVAWRSNQYMYAESGSYGALDLVLTVEAGVVVSSNYFGPYHHILASYNALNEETLYEFDSDQRLSKVTHPNGLVTDYTYDATSGYLSKVVDGNGTVTFRTNSYTFTNGWVWTHTDERSLSRTNLYDALGRLLRTSDPTGFITNTYDKLDLVRMVDRMGFTNRFEYDGFRQLTRSVNAIGATNIYQYCACGSLDSLTDPLGNITSYTYDNAGRRTRVTYPGNSYTDFAYDVAGRISRTADNLGVSVTNAYTINGLVYGVSNAFGRVFLRQFDDHDRVRWEQDRNGVIHGLSYDDLGRLILRTNRWSWSGPPGDHFDAVQDRYSYSYGIAGPVTTCRESVDSVTDDYGNLYFPTLNCLSDLVGIDYDLFGRKTNEVHFDPSGNSLRTNSFVYNAAGDLTRLNDGKAQKTTWKYDLYGRVTNKLDHADALMFSYTYDVNGRLTSRWVPTNGANGLTTSYGYDAAGNLTSVDYPNNADLTLQYDRMSRLTNLVDGLGATRYTYTAFGSLQSEDGPWADDTVTYSYTANRLRASLSLAQPSASAWTVAYGYDAANRLNAVSSPAGSFAYERSTGVDVSATSAAELVQKLTMANSAVITNQFNERARQLGTYLRTSGGTLLNQHVYNYNDLDQRTNQIRLDGDYVDYAYDPLQQLIGAKGKEYGGSTNRLHEQMGYAYDAAGNLQRRTNNALVQSFAVNSLNELSNVTWSGTLTVGGHTDAAATNVTVNTQTASRYADKTFAKDGFTPSAGLNTYTAVAKDNLGRGDTNEITANLPSNLTLAYDARGNLVTNGSRILVWDDENQLVSTMVSGVSSNAFVYDGKLRRRFQMDYRWNGSAWVKTNEVRFVYDDTVVLQERNELNVPQATLTRGLDLSGSLQRAGGIGGLLAISDQRSVSARHYCYHADGNGNVAALLDSEQRLSARYLYDPFGNTLKASGPSANWNRYRFSSKPVHEASGWYDYLYRWYAPELQRWPNRDPIAEWGGRNLYRFVHNDPVLLLDPEGLLVAPPLVGPPPVVVCSMVFAGFFGAAGGLSQKFGWDDWMADRMVPDIDNKPLPCPKPPRKSKPQRPDPQCGVTYDPAIPDHRDDLVDCYTQAANFDKYLIQTGRPPMTDQEFNQYVETCMRGKGFDYPP
jgi:RHS repeat-associated protein